MSSPESNSQPAANNTATKSNEKEKASKKNTPADKKGSKGTPAAGSETPEDVPFPEFDPENPEKNKITPDCASVSMGKIQTMS